MLDKSLVGIYDGKRTQRGLFSVGLVPVINLSREEEIIVFHFSGKRVFRDNKNSFTVVVGIMHSHMFINS